MSLTPHLHRPGPYSRLTTQNHGGGVLAKLPGDPSHLVRLEIARKPEAAQRRRLPSCTRPFMRARGRPFIASPAPPFTRVSVPLLICSSMRSSFGSGLQQRWL